MKMSMRQSVASAAVFLAVLLMLVSVDSRVREHFTTLVSSEDSVSSVGARAGDLGGTLASAVRHGSIENAPMMIFATVGGLLVVFMLKA